MRRIFALCMRRSGSFMEDAVIHSKSLELQRRGTPRDPAAEHATLGSILFRPDVLPDVAAVITPADSFDPANRRIFSAMIDLASQRKPIDGVTLLPKLKGKIDHAVVYLAELAQAVPTAAHAKHYAGIVADCAKKRKLLAIADAAHLAAMNGQPVASVVNALRSDLDDLSRDAGGFDFNRITSADLDSNRYDLEFLIDDILVAKQPCIVAGPQKGLKTTLLVDLAVTLDTGGHFCGYFPALRRANVGIMSGESGLAVLQETARRICSSAGVSLGELGIVWSDQIPQFDSPAQVEAVRRFIERDALEVLILDPAHLAMPSGDAGNLFAQGELLRSIAETSQAAG